MKIIEETQLKQSILKLNKYQSEYKGIRAYYRNLDELNLESLQDFSLEKDNEFFDEISFILSVITSIISRPQLSNKGEDIIIRADIAGHISTDAFKQVFKESNLWKEKNLEMVPEYVHHYQYTDELKIYENIFIGMIIKLIDTELVKYKDFYISLIPSFNQNDNIVLENKEIEKTLRTIEKLQRKLRYIKNTYFYREISKCNLTLKNIQPTNILLKNRLYNYCYKFYKKFIQYVDQESLLEDFRTYYKHLILKVFKANNFALDESKSQKINDLSFIFNDYSVQLTLNENKPSILLSIKYRSIVAKHQLLFDIERTLLQTNIESEEEVLTTNIITLWNIYDVENTNLPLFKNQVSEEELVKYWIMDKFQENFANRNLYEKYCPVCKGKNIDAEGELYSCPSCNSIYTFKKIENKDVIWFLKFRR